MADLTTHDSKGGPLQTTPNPAHAVVGVSPGTHPPITNLKAVGDIYEVPSLPSHQPLPTASLSVAPPTCGIVGVAREGIEEGVHDNIPDQ